VAQNNGYSRIDDVLDADIPIGATVIPVNAGTPSFFPDSGFIVVGDGVDREILEYSSTTETTFVLVTPTTLLHVEGTPIYALIDATFKLFIESQDGGEYRAATAVPTLTILNEFGTEESVPMVWDAVTNSYSFTKQYIATEYLAGKRNVIVTALVGTLTKVAFATYELLDRPASQQSLDEALGGGLMPDTFVFDHDGWKDNANIVHEWEDVMAGPLHDDTGKPATGILIRAFLWDDDSEKWLLVNNPPFQNYSNIFGHYRGSLEAGTYLFAFYKDNHKWKEVERTIDP
jgi:hypothetical protein